MTKKSKNKRKYETLEEEREARSVRAKNQNRLPNGRFCTLKDLDTKEFHQFLDLPLEIRFMIYEYLFATEKGTFQSCITAHAVERNEYWIAELYDEPDETYKPAPHHGLAAALPRPNHQVYHEATEFLYRSKNTVVAGHCKLLDEFVDMPRPLDRCVDLGCHHSSHKPQIEKLIWHLPEYSHRVLDLVEDPYCYDYPFVDLAETAQSLELATYLPQLGRRGGLRMKHLELYFGCGELDLSELESSITVSGIKISGTFTISVGGFQSELRIWLKSKESFDTIDFFNMTRG
jgi:hypothetical protein